MKYAVTGGAGFIGSRFVRLLLEREPGCEVLNLDKLSYSGDLTRLEDSQRRYGSRHCLETVDLAVPGSIRGKLNGVETVFHFAAESHVDRSLMDARPFFESNAAATQALLSEAKAAGVQRFVHVSTDEVYGPCLKGAYRETDPMNPKNPYSVSKAAAEFLAINAFEHTGLPVVISRGSNTYGPWQYPEKIIPLFISNALLNLPLPLYGDGLQERDWLHVDDHCEAVWCLSRKGVPGETYNISGGHHLTNLDLTRRLLKELGLAGRERELIQFVPDRLGHDRRYALDDAKLRGLGWKPRREFDEAFSETVRWYREHAEWVEKIRRKNEDFKNYLRRQYVERSAAG